jgi:hypothetical protein
MTIPDKPGEQVSGAVASTRQRIRKVVILVTLVPAILFGLLFLAALIVALADVEGAATFIRMIRDLMLVFIALELALIFVAISILLVQVARLLNLLTEEVAPLLDATQETVQTAQNTVQFAGRNVLGPFIQFSAMMTTLLSLLGSAFGLRRAYGKATKVKRDDHAE